MLRGKARKTRKKPSFSIRHMSTHALTRLQASATLLSLLSLSKRL